MDFRKRFAVPPDGKFKLADIDPAYKGEHEITKARRPRLCATPKPSLTCNTSFTPKAGVRYSLSCRVLMRQEKTASFVIFLIASIRKGST